MALCYLPLCGSPKVEPSETCRFSRSPLSSGLYSLRLMRQEEEEGGQKGYG